MKNRPVTVGRSKEALAHPDHVAEARADGDEASGVREREGYRLAVATAPMQTRGRPGSKQR